MAAGGTAVIRDGMSLVATKLLGSILLTADTKLGGAVPLANCHRIKQERNDTASPCLASTLLLTKDKLPRYEMIRYHTGTCKTNKHFFLISPEVTFDRDCNKWRLRRAATCLNTRTAPILKLPVLAS